MQRLNFVGAQHALPDLNLRNGTARNVAAEKLHACGKLLLGHFLLLAKPCHVRADSVRICFIHNKSLLVPNRCNEIIVTEAEKKFAPNQNKTTINGIS